MKDFEPRIYIGIGETEAYYTLRETYLHTIYIPSEGPNGNSVVNGIYQGQIRQEIRSFHHFNLSQNIDEAIAKAKAYSLKNGIPFYGTDKKKIEWELREIKKRTAEQIRNQIELEEKLKAERIESERIRMNLQNIKVFEEDGNYVQIGAYKGQHISNLPMSYCGWLVDNISSFEEISFLRYLANKIISDYPHLIPKKIELNKNSYFGEIKKRYDLTLYVLKSFSFDGFYGTTYTTVMADNDNNCFVVMSNSFSASVGEELQVKATVKEHSVYKGQAQTILNRVKLKGM